MTIALTFDRKTTMYGICQRINGRIGLAGETFAVAYFDGLKQTWAVEILGADGSVAEEYTVDASQSADCAVEAVEALMGLAYRSSLPKPAIAKVAARYLSKGDQVGSGETIVNVAVGIRTPRGKVEVTLEKDGQRRCAIWGASTVITVRRAA